MQENDSSTKSETKPQPKEVTFDQLEGLKTTAKYKEIVIVTDRDRHPYILLTDINDESVWYPISNLDADDAERSNEWFKQGLRMFKEKPLTKEDADLLRELLLAISVLASYFEWTEQMVAQMLDQMIMKFSVDLYKKDRPDFNGDLETLRNNDDFMPYLNLTVLLVKTYQDIVADVRESAEQAREDAKTLATDK